MIVNNHQGSWAMCTRRPGCLHHTRLYQIQDADARPLSTIWRSHVIKRHGTTQLCNRTSWWW